MSIPTHTRGAAALFVALAAAGALSSAQAQDGLLTADEKAEGFVPLFDGRTLEGWRLYRQPQRPVRGWRVVDGAITRVAADGDLVTDKAYADFELRLDWKVAPKGNSGIFYRASESEPAIYHSAPEYQVLDNLGHPDGKDAKTSASAAYGLFAPAKSVAKPAGQWNSTRIIVRGSDVEHWLNDEKVVEYTLGSPEWKALVAASKFKEWPTYGQARSGHIGLQDHGDEVAYRNIRIKVLQP